MRSSRYFTVPRTFLATNRTLVMENASQFPDFFEFVKTHPAERVRLYDFLRTIPAHHGFAPDTLDIIEAFTSYDRSISEKSAIFVKQFDPRKSRPVDRYQLIVTDFTPLYSFGNRCA